MENFLKSTAMFCCMEFVGVRKLEYYLRQMLQIYSKKKKFCDIEDGSLRRMTFKIVIFKGTDLIWGKCLSEIKVTHLQKHEHI